MKGVLLKRNKNWFIEYTATNGSPNLIQIYPDYVKYYFLDDDAIDGEVYFEIEYINNREYAKLIHPSKLDLKQLEDKLDEALAKETTESLTEWMDSKRKDDVEKAEKEYCEELINRREAAKNFTGQVAGRHSDMFSGHEMTWMTRGFIDGYKKAKETLYTKEQIVEAFKYAYLIGEDHIYEYDANQAAKKYIQSLKK